MNKEFKKKQNISRVLLENYERKTEAFRNGEEYKPSHDAEVRKADKEPVIFSKKYQKYVTKKEFLELFGDTKNNRAYFDKRLKDDNKTKTPKESAPKKEHKGALKDIVLINKDNLNLYLGELITLENWSTNLGYKSFKDFVDEQNKLNKTPSISFCLDYMLGVYCKANEAIKCVHKNGTYNLSLELCEKLHCIVNFLKNYNKTKNLDDCNIRDLFVYFK